MNCGTPSAFYPIVISSSSLTGRLCLLRPSVLPDSYVRVRVVSVGSSHPHRTKSGRPLCVRQSPMPISCLRGSTKNRSSCYIGKTMRTHSYRITIWEIFEAPTLLRRDMDGEMTTSLLPELLSPTFRMQCLPHGLIGRRIHSESRRSLSGASE